MLTILSLDKANPGRFLPLGYKISQEVKSVAGVDVRCIEYIYKRNVRWNKISKLCGSEGRRLLCDEKVDFPSESGLMRFYCDELKVRLCLNMAIEILRNLKDVSKELKVGIYDIDGRIVDGASQLIKFCRTVSVTTSMTGMYSAEAQRLLEESGAVLGVGRRMKPLADADIVIAPSKIKTLLPLKKQAIILTTASPAVSQNCGVYYKYYFVAEDVAKLLPKGIEAEYFYSALYTLCGRYDLGSIVPQAAKGLGETHTLVSMSKYLMNIAAST